MTHAYLIMAHNNPNQLYELLNLLDYSNNDIYLHIDIKSNSINKEIIKNSIINASIHIYQLYDVKWADMSQTKCQVFLLSEAVKSHHDYYHLISGQDLPIKKHEEIDAFFAEHNGVQFVHFDSVTMKPKETSRFYHFGTGEFENFFVRIQRKIGFNRHIPTGANWYSITHELAVDFCEHKKRALRAVKYTISSDECILQNFICNISHNTYRLYKAQSDGGYDSNMRLIDWNRGNGRNPYVWRITDYEEIIHSDRLFARKFDEKIDQEIITRIIEKINE